jgi:acetyl-CoA/propionyl-CoA carboxylase biotin carboxyl carrier protein
MKMEHTLTAPITGQVEVLFSVGDQVAVDQVLARVVPDEVDGADSADHSEDERP